MTVKCIEVKSGQLLGALSAPGPDGNWDMRCDGVLIQRVRDGIRELACAHPVHGVNERYRDIAARLARAVRDAGIEETSVCPICGGSGWLNASGSDAVRQKMMGHALGVYRGIRLPGPGLTVDDLGATIQAILSKGSAGPDIPFTISPKVDNHRGGLLPDDIDDNG